MDFVCELILEIVQEGIFGLTVKNPKAKTWVKTAVFLIFSEAVAGLFLWISFAAPAQAGMAGAVVCRIIAIAMGIGFLLMTVDGHKRNWKQDFD